MTSARQEILSFLANVSGGGIFILNRSNFSESEWTCLLRAPFLAGLLIGFASPSGLVGSIKEAYAARKLLVETKQNGGKNALIDALVADLDTDDGRSRADLLHLANRTGDDAVRAICADLRAASLAAYHADPALGAGFAAWILAIARAVAEASREGGGLLGIGGKLVSDAEEAALERIRTALDPMEGVPA